METNRMIHGFKFGWFGKHAFCLAPYPLTSARKSTNVDIKIITGVAKNMLNNTKNPMAIAFTL
jgi:hypothetical protein